MTLPRLLRRRSPGRRRSSGSLNPISLDNRHPVVSPRCDTHCAARWLLRAPRPLSCSHGRGPASAHAPLRPRDPHLLTVPARWPAPPAPARTPGRRPPGLGPAPHPGTTFAACARSWVTGFAAPSPRLIGFASSLLNVYNRDRGRGRGCSVSRSGTRASACGPHAHIEKPRSSHGEAGADGEPAGLAAWGLRVCSPIAGTVFTEDGARGRGGRSRSGSCTAVGPALPARRVFAWDRVSGTRVDLRDSGREAALRGGSGAAIAAHRVTGR